jgi:L-asparaginase
MAKQRILLVSTGGTITMTAKSGNGMVPTLSGQDLVQAVPSLGQIAEIEVISFSSKPSASLTLEDLVSIAALLDAKLASDFTGAAVVQGTDTIEETAFVLDLLVASDRPVVVTGAMRGPNAPGADGPANLLAAVTVAADSQACGLGAVAVLNDEVHAGRFVQKSHTALPSAFSSPGFSPIGRVIEGAVHLYSTLPRRAALPRPEKLDDSPVALIKMVLGDDGRLLAALPQLGYRGVVIEAMGAGHVPAQLVPVISNLVEKMPVVLSTRIANSPVFTKSYGFPGSEIDLLARGVIPGGTLVGTKACLLMRLLIANQLEADALRTSYMQWSNYPRIMGND